MRKKARPRGLPKHRHLWPPQREVVIVAQDPTVKVGGKMLRSSVFIPLEDLDRGPCGARVQVVDYDATSGLRYEAPDIDWIPTPEAVGKISDGELLSSPGFHAWNAYAVVMRTLGRFELALGRRVAWGFRGHQLWVAPHAFADANAFYSEDDGALLLGYVPAPRARDRVFTCLSHDIVAHETTHALLDGLRTRFTDPSSPEQAAFHEGFADVVALLSILSSREVVRSLLANSKKSSTWRRDRIPRSALLVDNLRDSPLFGLAEQLGEDSGIGVRRAALRTSLELEPDSDLLDTMLEQNAEEHDLGELFVAAMMRAYVKIWHRRLVALSDEQSGPLSTERAVEEAADLADRFLNVAIRAIDFLPVVDVHFGEFVRALVTADEQVYPDDDRYRIREHVPQAFYDYGVHDRGRPWQRWPTPAEQRKKPALRTGLHLLPLQTDPSECFQFLWENRNVFEIDNDAFVQVQSVRPAMRHAEDGAFVRETIIEYVEQIELEARELKRRKVRTPNDMPADTRLKLYGGGAMILDEFGDVKFHIKSSLFSPEQGPRIASLWSHGYFRDRPHAKPRRRAFAQLHLKRATAFAPASREDW